MSCFFSLLSSSPVFSLLQFKPGTKYTDWCFCWSSRHQNYYNDQRLDIITLAGLKNSSSDGIFIVDVFQNVIFSKLDIHTEYIFMYGLVYYSNPSHSIINRSVTDNRLLVWVFRKLSSAEVLQKQTQHYVREPQIKLLRRKIIYFGFNIKTVAGIVETERLAAVRLDPRSVFIDSRCLCWCGHGHTSSAVNKAQASPLMSPSALPGKIFSEIHQPPLSHKVNQYRNTQNRLVFGSPLFCARPFVTSEAERRVGGNDADCVH